MTERVWTPVDLIRWTTEFLASKGFHNARLNAELLLAGVLDCKRLDLYLQFDRPLAPPELAEFKQRLLRRARREPLQYIEGFAAFRDLRLRVDPRVLIPRAETEVLVAEVLRWATGRSGLGVVDVGTGSGAIAISLATEGAAHFARVAATDVSQDALELAADNAEAMRASVEFRHGPCYEPIGTEKFDIIVSNPPYIADADGPALDAEVRDWEPQAALYAGPDGLDVLRDLVTGAPAHLEGGGLLALETGDAQTGPVADAIRELGCFREPSVVKDLAGRPRIVTATFLGGE